MSVWAPDMGVPSANSVLWCEWEMSSHTFRSSTTWSPAGGTVSEGCGTFVRLGLTGGQVLGVTAGSISISISLFPDLLRWELRQPHTLTALNKTTPSLSYGLYLLRL